MFTVKNRTIKLKICGGQLRLEPPALFVLCCYTRTPETGKFTKNRGLFLTVLGDHKSKVRGWDLTHVEGGRQERGRARV